MHARSTLDWSQSKIFLVTPYELVITNTAVVVVGCCSKFLFPV